MKNVLVTDSNSRKSLCVVRSLGKQGYNVIATSNYNVDISRSSKYCSAFRKITDYNIDEEQFIKELLKVIKDYSIEIIIPMEDDTLELILKHQEKFKHIKSLLPSYEAFRLARDKGKTVESAMLYNVPIPKTYNISNNDNLARRSEGFRYPIILKPRISSGSRGITIVESSNEFLKKYDEVNRLCPNPVVQEFLQGNFKKIQVLVIADQNSNIKASCTYRGIREFPVSGGPVTFWKTASYPEIEKTTFEFLEKVKWTGFAEAEYMFNVDTGEFYLIEINPRFSANISLAVSLGIDFPLYYTKLSLGEKIQGKINEEFNSFGQWLIPGDLLNFIFNKKRFKQEYGYFFKKPKKLTHAIFSKSDIKPFFTNLISLILNLVTNIQDLIVKLGANTK